MREAKHSFSTTGSSVCANRFAQCHIGWTELTEIGIITWDMNDH